MLRSMLLLPGRATLHHLGRLFRSHFQTRDQLHWSISESTAQLATIPTQPTTAPVAAPVPATLTFPATLTVLPTGRARRHAAVPSSATFAP